MRVELGLDGGEEATAGKDATLDVVEEAVVERDELKLYAIRRPSGWSSPSELPSVVERSKEVGDEEMSDDIRWIRSYVVHEEDGSLGTICIYRASSPEKIREHAAARVDMPAPEIFEIADTLVVRPDPVKVAA